MRTLTNHLHAYMYQILNSESSPSQINMKFNQLTSRAHLQVYDARLLDHKLYF